MNGCWGRRIIRRALRRGVGGENEKAARVGGCPGERKIRKADYFLSEAEGSDPAGALALSWRRSSSVMSFSPLV